MLVAESYSTVCVFAGVCVCLQVCVCKSTLSFSIHLSLDTEVASVFVLSHLSLKSASGSFAKNSQHLLAHGVSFSGMKGFLAFMEGHCRAILHAVIDMLLLLFFCLPTEGGSGLEEAGFNWGEYLEETGASAAPHTSFKHVEISIQSNFQPGMKLEVANKKNPDTYWVATVITTCGQLLLLRYCGYGEDRRADFWCDVVIADLHPVGWCTQNNKTLMPPDAIKEKYTDWTEFLIRDLTGSRTAPASLLEGDHADLRSHFFTVGMKLEAVNMSEPSHVCPASVTKVRLPPQRSRPL
uniref:Scm like with four mbt domains 2 n=1 Tax=Sus scrofa TaxID=9823 RepID=A0A8D0RA97_PIG